jgi:hypothetical protein
MDIFFEDPNETRLPPEEVRIHQIVVNPLPNGNRVKVYLELTPFMKKPNIEVAITNSSGKETAHTSILETMSRKMEITMHLRESDPGNEYTIEAIVYYQRLPGPSDATMDVPIPDPLIVDHQKKVFIFP